MYVCSLRSFLLCERNFIEILKGEVIDGFLECKNCGRKQFKIVNSILKKIISNKESTNSDSIL